MRLTSFFVLAAAVTSCLADATPLINTITQQIGPLTNQIAEGIKAFPASGLNGSLTLDQAADNLITALDNATGDAQSAGTFTLLETLEVTTTLDPIASTTEATLADLVKKMADFISIGRASFVLANLQILNIRTSEFWTILVANAAVGQAAALTAEKDRLETAFASAIKAYES